ncbi:MAG: paraslipin, partial [Pseudomonadales bacterium]|nr:paraslipin [Pseudomonadales bacterium]
MVVTDLLGFFFNVWVLLSIVGLVVLKQSVRFVPQNTALVVERFGK